MGTGRENGDRCSSSMVQVTSQTKEGPSTLQGALSYASCYLDVPFGKTSVSTMWREPIAMPDNLGSNMLFYNVQLTSLEPCFLKITDLQPCF